MYTGLLSHPYRSVYSQYNDVSGLCTIQFLNDSNAGTLMGAFLRNRTLNFRAVYHTTNNRTRHHLLKYSIVSRHRHQVHTYGHRIINVTCRLTIRTVNGHLVTDHKIMRAITRSRLTNHRNKHSSLIRRLNTHNLMRRRLTNVTRHHINKIRRRDTGLLTSNNTTQLTRNRSLMTNRIRHADRRTHLHKLTNTISTLRHGRTVLDKLGDRKHDPFLRNTWVQIVTAGS